MPSFADSQLAFPYDRDVVENSIESDLELVDGAIGEYVGFGDCDVAPVVVDILVAGEGILFGKSRSAAGYVRSCLIVAETGKHRILAGKVVVETNVELAFVQLTNRNIGIVDDGTRIRSGRRREEINHRLPDWVEQCWLESCCRGSLWQSGSRRHLAQLDFQHRRSKMARRL